MRNMEIAGYCVYIVGEANEEIFKLIRDEERDTLTSGGKLQHIYCNDEEDAKQLSQRIPGSIHGPWYGFVRGAKDDPTLY